MEFFEAVEARRSVRVFSNETVPPEVINKALDAAVLAPNSSNIQAWEFYWVRSADKKAKLVEACFSQSAAKTAGELIVAVSRVDTWKRNRDLILENLGRGGAVPKGAQDYYNKAVPIAYSQDPFGVLGVIKKLVMTAVGFFRPVPRRPAFRSEIFEVVTKSSALACENFMLAIAAQGFATCPMEGFDECRVQKILGLNRHTHVVMVMGVGRATQAGIWGERFRVPRSLVIKEV